jgi:hypothetical protein
VSAGDDWSPDEPQGTETFEQDDETFDEEDRLDPRFLENVEGDPSINPVNDVDDLELKEAGLELDDPEAIVTMQGGGDDPDGIEPATLAHRPRGNDDPGWDLQGPEETDPDDER